MAKAKPKRRSRKSRIERITILPTFKPGARVKWNDGTRDRAGVARDVHKLGGHGYAYEVLADGETLPDEITEAELRAEPPHEHPLLAELLRGLRDKVPMFMGDEYLALREAWIAAGCPGLKD